MVVDAVDFWLGVIEQLHQTRRQGWRLVLVAEEVVVVARDGREELELSDGFGIFQVAVRVADTGRKLFNLGLDFQVGVVEGVGVGADGDGAIAAGLDRPDVVKQRAHCVLRKGVSRKNLANYQFLNSVGLD